MYTYFKNIKDLQDLKSQFKKLAMQWHPDTATGDTETMQKINNEYDILFQIYKKKTVTVETAASTRKSFYEEQGWKGKNYNSNLNTTEISKILRQYVKAQYPDYKFSITSKYYSGGSSINIYLMEAPYPAYTDNREVKGRGFYESDKELTEIIREVLKDVKEMTNSYNFDYSDSMTDYFHVNFYSHIGIGQWDKPFKVVEKQVKLASKKTKENRETNSNEVTEVNKKSNNMKCEIIEDIDTRDNTPLWVLKIINTLSRDEYINVAQKFKEIGGYYSKFKRGFIFKENPDLQVITNATC